uniref:RRM domain-containing protein n=1 Tax=Angiostrongylus cantonensis TaxID=6313 RepID=A0A0K0DJN3_ANGCA
MQDHSLGAEVVSFCPELELYLSPLSRVEINIKLPKFTIPGQSISNWDLMERLKKGVAPIQVSSLFNFRLRNIQRVINSVVLQAIKILESMTVKVSGFSDPVRVRAAEAKSDFPSRHDWDLFYMKNKLDESKPGERPDTIYMAKIPIKFTGFGLSSDLPSEDLLRYAMEAFGNVRMVDIPVCDEIRREMDPEISGIRNKGFSFGPDVFFEAYVQFAEYSGFVNAMDSLRNMKWTKRIDKKVFHANVKVSSKYHSDYNACNRSNSWCPSAYLRQKEAEARRVLEEKERKREERERKRKERVLIGCIIYSSLLYLKDRNFLVIVRS